MRRVLFVLLFAAPWGMAAQAPIVRTIRVRKTDLARTVRIPGSVLPYEEAVLVPHVTGYVERVTVREGAWVSKGDVLATIHVPLMAEDLARTRAAVHAAEAAEAAEAAKERVSRAKVAIQRPSLRRAEAELALRRIRLERLRKLRDDMAATDEQIDNARGELAIATAAAAMEEAEVAGAVAGVKAAEAEVKRARARVAAARAEEARLEAMGKLARIRCPYERGLVTRRDIDSGALVKADTTPMFVVMDVERVRVRLDLDERDAVHVKAGSKAGSRVRVTPDAQGDDVRETTLTRIARALDLRTRTMRLEVDLPNADHRLLAGMFVHVDLEVYRRPGALIVPASCLEVENDGTYLLVVKDGRAARVRVRTGLDDGMRIEVVDGVAEGAEVILLGKEKPRDGSPVRTASGTGE
ncbi:MAG: efflux RND transporter periplasmic adaptor subunit [Planctomycetota bacterium]